jgi:release factor glutamine methyltransferase
VNPPSLRGKIVAILGRAKRLRDVLGFLPPILSEISGIAEPEAEARALLKALPRPAGMTFDTFLEQRPTADQALFEMLSDWMMRRIAREPLDRILGHRAFWTLELALNGATLSPRADSETLVEAAFRWLRVGNTNPFPRILDLGTGSGALLLALLSELPHATGLGIDLAEDAITIARANAVRNEPQHPGLTARVAFQTSCWFEGLEERFDLIVSNPPYIPRAEIAMLEPEVRDHDPPSALDGGEDGLDAYRAILSNAHPFLTVEGALFLEIGWDQADSVTRIATEKGFRLAGKYQDLGGHDRVLCFLAAK